MYLFSLLTTALFSEEHFLQSVDSVQDWQLLGRALKISQPLLDKIEENHSNDDYDKCKLQIFKVCFVHHNSVHNCAHTSTLQ